jgi:hypothetical protein
MGFIGRLEEMPLQDTVQILAMSKRTGKLNLTRGPAKAVVAFKEGHVICAISDTSRETLGSMLVRKGLISDATLSQALKIQKHRLPWRLLGSLLVDMGAITKAILDSAIREHIEMVIGELLTWDSGYFKFEPLTDDELLAEEFGGAGLILRDGVSTAQTVLEALRRLDEASKEPNAEQASPPPPVPFPVPMRKSAPGEQAPISNGQVALAPQPEEEATPSAQAIPAALDGQGSPSGKLSEFDLISNLLDLDHLREGKGHAVELKQTPDVTLVKAIMDEIRSPRFAGEISLMIMRYAAEVMRRGILFAVRDNGVTILGEFGIRWRDPTVRRKHQKVPISLERLASFNEVIESRRTYKGRLAEAAANLALQELIDGPAPQEFVVVPMIVEGDVAAILYGDNSPNNVAIGSTECLELLMIHAGLCIEKTRLEMRIKPR